jgi:hypothetical protein
MVFCQVLVLTADRTLYNVGIHGRKKIKVLGMTYSDDPPADNIVVALKSDVLCVNYGTNRNIVFSNASTGFRELNFEFESNLIGSIDIELVNVLTNVHPVGFTNSGGAVAGSHMILYLDISDV